MHSKIKIAVPLAITALMASGAAIAGTRSGQALPGPSASHTTSPGQAHAPQGPKNGFPDNRGIERAMEVANENARFKRPDSHG